MKSPGRTSGPRGRPRVERKEEILDAAERLYADIGFDKTSMADIAEEIGMSPANLYRSFAARRDIDHAIAQRRLGLIEDAAWAAIRDAGHDPEAAFHDLIEVVAARTSEILFDEGRLSELCMIAANENWPVVAQFVDRLRSALRHVLLEGQRAQAFDPALEPDATASLLLATLLRVWHPIIISIYSGEQNTMNALSAQEVGDFLLRAIKMTKK